MQPDHVRPLTTDMENDEVLEVVEDLAHAIARGDDGDIDSPSWENERRLALLNARLVELVLWRRAGARSPGREPQGSTFEPD